MTCPDPPKGLRRPNPMQDDDDVYVAQKVAAEKGLCLYLDAEGGKITLCDVETGKVEASGLTADEVIASFGAKTWWVHLDEWH
jgi:hypothetical protein